MHSRNRRGEGEKVNRCRGSVVLPHFFMLENWPLPSPGEGKMSPLVTKFRGKELVNTGLSPGKEKERRVDIRPDLW